MVIRGAVYEANLGAPRGHAQGGRRLGIVVSPSKFPWSVATIVPTSTSATPSVFRPELEFLGRATRVLTDQITTIDTDYLSVEPVDYLTRDQLAEIDHALAHYLGNVPKPVR